MERCGAAAYFAPCLRGVAECRHAVRGIDFRHQVAIKRQVKQETLLIFAYARLNVVLSVQV